MLPDTQNTQNLDATSRADKDRQLCPPCKSDANPRDICAAHSRQAPDIAANAPHDSRPKFDDL